MICSKLPYVIKNVFSNDVVKDKIKQTNRERYNSDYPLQNKDIIAKEAVAAISTGVCVVSATATT